MGWAERNGQHTAPTRKPLVDSWGIIACISGDQTCYPQFASAIATIQPPPGSMLHWQIVGGGGVADARNRHVEKALEHGAHWLFFCDSDHSFPKDVLLKLLRHNRDIVVPTVMMRIAPFEWVAWESGYDIAPTASDAELVQLFGQHPNPPTLTRYRQGLVELGAAGTGCMLIAGDVLRAMPAPWFQFGMFPGNNVGEDTFFCLKARRLGFRIWCDLDVSISHLTTAAIWPARDPVTGAVTSRLTSDDFSPTGRP